MRSLDRLFIGVLVSLVTILGCDSTVAIDTTRPSVRKAIVYGACGVGDQSTLSQVRMSVLLEADDGSAADPSFQLFEQERLLGELMSAESFKFELNSDAVGTDANAGIPGATVTRDGATETQNIAFNANSVDYAAPGYAYNENGTVETNVNERAAIDGKSKLVIFAVDNSGSLIGLDSRQNSETAGTYIEAAASDRGDNRQVMFEDLLDVLRPNDYVALANIGTDSPSVSPCVLPMTTLPACEPNNLRMCSEPTLNRADAECGLRAMARKEGRVTNMNDSLKRIYNEIIMNNADLNPVVVLFTDGAEEDEEIDAVIAPFDFETNLGGALDLYARGYERNVLSGPVPILVLHLDQKGVANADFGFRMGRDQRLMKLACDTGGDYLFLETAEEMTSSRLGSLSRIIRNRIYGSWSVLD